MPPRGRRAAAAPAPEPEVEAEDYSKYLEKDLTPTMSDYADWFEENVAPLADLELDRILALGTTLYPKFQKSEFNVSRRDARRAERASAGEPEEAAAPARGRGRGRAASAPASGTNGASAKATARGRGKAKETAGAEAPY